MRRWGRFTETSPIYGRLIEAVADDEVLLGILNEIEHTPQANILFAGVQYLLMAEPGHPLTRFFPNLGGRSEPERMVRPFSQFVLERRDELIEIGRTRYTQTNECRRCVALLPAVWRLGVGRFHLIDVGTSAGLNLAIDRYRYEWDGVTWGSGPGPILKTRLSGEPPNPTDITVLSRTGLDLRPVDVGDEEERRWLEALIWPEHADRRQRLRQAIDTLAQTEGVALLGGDAVDTLGGVLADLADGEAAVVVNSFALNQFSPAARQQLSDLIDGARSDRDVLRVSMESIGTDGAFATIEIDDGSGWTEIGRAQPHGEWLELYALP